MERTKTVSGTLVAFVTLLLVGLIAEILGASNILPPKLVFGEHVNDKGVDMMIIINLVLTFWLLVIAVAKSQLVQINFSIRTINNWLWISAFLFLHSSWSNLNSVDLFVKYIHSPYTMLMCALSIKLVYTP